MAASFAQDVNLRVPSGAVAGQQTSISTSGGGSATFYLVGPALALKRDVQLGQEILATDWYTCYLSIQKGGGTASLVDASGIVDDARYPTPSALSSRSQRLTRAPEA